MNIDETKQPMMEKKIIINLDSLKKVLTEINAHLHDYDGTLNRLSMDQDSLQEKTMEDAELKKKIEWENMTISEKIWQVKSNAERSLNYLKNLNRRFNSLI